MNLVQVIELQNAVRAFHNEKRKGALKLCIFDTQKEGYVIYVKGGLVNTEYFNFLNDFVNLEKSELKNRKTI
jgi:hypothetical protein